MAGVIIGSFPPCGFTSEETIPSMPAHASAILPVGAMYTVTSASQWSMIAYYQAGATITKGDALIHDTSQYKSWRLLRSATANEGQIPRGFAAADVNNTAYYSFRYIAGYCPTIKFLSNVASNQVTNMAGSQVGAMSSFPGNGTLGTTASFTLHQAMVYSLDVNAATAVNSGIIQGFLL